MKISTPMWTFLGGLITAAIGITLLLVGANQTIDKIDPSTGKPPKDPINGLVIDGTVLSYVGGTISSVGILWLVIALIANAVRMENVKNKNK
jgi:hypothetical protein